MKKRIADWLEKASVGSFIIGYYQNNLKALLTAGALTIFCLTLTAWGRKQEGKKHD